MAHSAVSTTTLVTLTSSLAAAITASANGSIISNTTSHSTVDYPLPDVDISEGNYFLNTLIGILIVLGASLFNAFGLNLTKLDHVRQQAIPKRERRKEYLRLLWLAGMGMYILSQVFGSTLALRWIRPDWVAPLGSSSLIFNFLFASWLVGTPVTKTDINGTGVIVLGVILIMVFSSINHGLQQLNTLWTRPSWLAFFLFLLLFTSTTYLSSHLLQSLLRSRASYSPLPSPTIELQPRPTRSNPLFAAIKRLGGGWKRVESFSVARLEKIFARADDARLTWLEGVGWAVTGGNLAGMCLVFTKALMKILWLKGHPLLHASSILTLLLVIGSAVLQIVCLNRALKCADTVVVVPLFYAGYTVFGFINSLIFYDEAGSYARWVLIAVFLSIAVLISGVILLSLKSSAKASTDPYTVSTQPAGSLRLRPRPARKAKNSEDVETVRAGPSKLDDEDEADEGSDRAGSRGGGGGMNGHEDVLWEVGTASDVSDDGAGRDGEKSGADSRKGVGGGNVRGEKRGLLVDEEEAEAEGEEGEGGRRDREEAGPGKQDGPGRNPFVREDEEEDGFGEYEGVPRDPEVEVDEER